MTFAGQSRHQLLVTELEMTPRGRPITQNGAAHWLSDKSVNPSEGCVR